MRLRSASPWPRVCSPLRLASALMTVASRSAGRLDAVGLGGALRAELGGLAEALGAHALEHVLGVLLRKVGALDAHVDDLEAELLALLVHLLGDAVHQLLAAVAHELLEGGRAEHAPQRRFHDRPKPRAHVPLVAHRLIEEERVGDAITREGVDDDALLVGGGDLLRLRVEVEDAAVEILHRVDQRPLPVQPRLRDRLAAHLGSPKRSTSACSFWWTMNAAA